MTTSLKEVSAAVKISYEIDESRKLDITAEMIAIISGSRREGNNSQKIARHVKGLYEAQGEETELLDLQELPMEAFSGGIYASKPETLTVNFTDKILRAEGLVVVVGEYNGSYPGVLKHFIDLLPFPESFDCRPVAFVGLSAGYYGGLRAVEQLQMVFAYRNAHLCNRRVFIPNVYKVLGEDGTVEDEEVARRLSEQAGLFLEFVRKLKTGS